MSDINSVLTQAFELRGGISRFLRSSTYQQYDDLSGLSINTQDSEQLFLWDQLRYIMERLADAGDAIRCLELPVGEISRLHKNASGRYETAGGRVFCCGSPVEALVSDGGHDAPYWTRTSVGYGGEDYYLVGHRDVSMNGLVIRTREK